MDMAPSVLPTSRPEPSPSRTTSNLRNPLPLSASQEAQVRDIYHRNVRAMCGPEIKAFAHCARGRTVSLAWACKNEQLAMNSCMMGHATREEEDRAREEWFRGVEEQQRTKNLEREKVEERRREVIEMTKRQEEREKVQQEAERKKKELEVEGKKGWWK